jgi:molecular chaperone GrpE (heat shock protein)
MFDPNFHEAMEQSQVLKEDNGDISSSPNGYTLNERLIRPAKVTFVKN